MAMIGFHAVRFHLSDEELKESDAALSPYGGKRGTIAKRIYMDHVRAINDERKAEKRQKTKR